MTHFEPADRREHARGNAGYPVTDRCINCGQPFMAHYNGTCPAEDAEDEICPGCGGYNGRHVTENCPARAAQYGGNGYSGAALIESAKEIYNAYVKLVGETGY